MIDIIGWIKDNFWRPEADVTIERYWKERQDIEERQEKFDRRIAKEPRPPKIRVEKNPPPVELPGYIAICGESRAIVIEGISIRVLCDLPPGHEGQHAAHLSTYFF